MMNIVIVARCCHYIELPLSTCMSRCTLHRVS
jgi:hypothetical protein